MFACNNIHFYCKGYIYGDQQDLEKDHVIHDRGIFDGTCYAKNVGFF